MEPGFRAGIKKKCRTVGEKCIESDYQGMQERDRKWKGSVWHRASQDDILSPNHVLNNIRISFLFNFPADPIFFCLDTENQTTGQ